MRASPGRIRIIGGRRAPLVANGGCARGTARGTLLPRSVAACATAGGILAWPGEHGGGVRDRRLKRPKSAADSDYMYQVSGIFWNNRRPALETNCEAQLSMLCCWRRQQ